MYVGLFAWLTVVRFVFICVLVEARCTHRTPLTAHPRPQDCVGSRTLASPYTVNPTRRQTLHSAPDAVLEAQFSCSITAECAKLQYSPVWECMCGREMARFLTQRGMVTCSCMRANVLNSRQPNIWECVCQLRTHTHTHGLTGNCVITAACQNLITCWRCFAALPAQMCIGMGCNSVQAAGSPVEIPGLRGIIYGIT